MCLPKNYPGGIFLDLSIFISLLGGVALFLFGMTLMGDGLKKVAGNRLELVLYRLTGTPLRGVLLGAGVTAVIQSSSATSVMVVGFVNSGVMKLSQAISVIQGALIGTSITGWIIALSSVEGAGWTALFSTSNLSALVAIVGVILRMFSKKQIHHHVGDILLGFAVLMFGMHSMSGAVEPLREDVHFLNLMSGVSHPVLGILVGAAFTAVLQSASAAVGILQALSMTGAISYGMAIPIVMGQNIGTCVTAVLSTIGVSKNAKRVAVIHIAFNLIGTAIFLLLFYGAHAAVGFTFLDDAVGPVGIALFHTIFNVGTTVLLLPFTNQLVKIATKAVKVEPPRKVAFLDERLLETPAFAVAQCKRLGMEMAELVAETMALAMKNLNDYDEETGNRIRRMEEDADIYEDHLSGYLVRLSGADLSEEDNRTAAVILNSIGDWERISDHALNLEESAEELEGKGLEMSPAAMAELAVLEGAVAEIVDLVRQAFTTEDLAAGKALAMRVEPLEEVVDVLTDEIKRRHIQRLQTGECTIEKGFILTDILTGYERVSDHCSNIALALLGETADAHDYTQRLKMGDDGDFRTEYEEFSKKYALPA